MFSKLLLGSVLILGFVASAGAADLPAEKGPPVYVPPVPVFTWTGPYIGINGGGAFGRTDVFDFNVVDTTAHHDVSGGLAGGTFGYNYQISSFVLGAEGDADWADVSGSTVCPARAETCSTRVSFLGSVRGRIGYAWDRLLIFATGGLGLGDFKYSASSPTFSASDYLFRAGFAAGGGIEYAFNDNWSAKVEYTYYGFPTAYGEPPIHSVNTVNFRTYVQTVKAGINYRFDFAPPPAPPVAAKY
jgi:outer membrane immunogenic protein